MRLQTAQEIVAANLTRLLTQRGLSQNQLAVKCGLNQTTVGHVRRAEVAAQVDSLERIATVFGLQPWQMLVPDLDLKRPPQISDLTDKERRILAIMRE